MKQETNTSISSKPTIRAGWRILVLLGSCGIASLVFPAPARAAEGEQATVGVYARPATATVKVEKSAGRGRKVVRFFRGVLSNVPGSDSFELASELVGKGTDKAVEVAGNKADERAEGKVVEALEYSRPVQEVLRIVGERIVGLDPERVVDLSTRRLFPVLSHGGDRPAYPDFSELESTTVELVLDVKLGCRLVRYGDGRLLPSLDVEAAIIRVENGSIVDRLETYFGKASNLFRKQRGMRIPGQEEQPSAQVLREYAMQHARPLESFTADGGKLLVEELRGLALAATEEIQAWAAGHDLLPQTTRMASATAVVDPVSQPDEAARLGGRRKR